METPESGFDYLSRNAADQINKIEAEIERRVAIKLEAERSELNNLLAIMHGDGGHHQQKVGTKQAILDAIELLHKKWVTNEMLYDINELRNKVIEECFAEFSNPEKYYTKYDIMMKLNSLKTK